MENESPNGENKKDSLVQQFEKTLFNDAVDTKEFGIKEAPAGMYFEIIKGQLILKASFEVFIWTKNWTNIFLYCISKMGQM